MLHLPKRIQFEASACLAQQLPCHSEVSTDSMDVDVAHIRCEMWEKLLHVLAFAIPGNETSHREGMTKIVHSWLIPAAVRTENPSSAQAI